MTSRFARTVNIIRWIFGGLIILFSLLVIKELSNVKDFLTWLLMLFAGLLILPPTYRFLKKYYWVSLLIGLLLFFLNPSLAAFRNYAKELSDPKETIYKRQSNYLIFSFYVKEWEGVTDWDRSQLHSQRTTYLAIAGNFFKWDYDIDF
jgi:hypothetical protein